MSKVDGPRHGSMQFWPRKRAKKEVARVRGRVFNEQSMLDGFCGYKVGMTHIAVRDTYQHSITKDMVIIKPVTVIECPPIKVAGIRFYKKSSSNSSSLVPDCDIFADKLDKELSRRMIVPKAKELMDKDYDDIRIIVYTQPKLSALPKKKPEVFELCIKGTKEEKLAYAKEKLGKEIDISEIFKLNELVDIHAVTKGKGFQGPVKRFGVQIRSHKSEKTKRGPGSLGSWCGQQHFMYRVAHAGQTGYHLRTEHNKAIIYIGNDIEKINPEGGFVNYGNIKSSYILLMGSVPGSKKRMLKIMHAMRPEPKLKSDKLQIVNISRLSPQGK